MIQTGVLFDVFGFTCPIVLYNNRSVSDFSGLVCRFAKINVLGSRRCIVRISRQIMILFNEKGS